MATSVVKGFPVQTGTITYIGSGNPVFESEACSECDGTVTISCRCYNSGNSKINGVAYGYWFQLPTGFRPRVRTAINAYIIFDGAKIIPTDGIPQTTVTRGYINTDGRIEVNYTSTTGVMPIQVAVWGMFHI